MHLLRPRYIIFILYFVSFGMSTEIQAQRKKEPKITDEIGILAGLNIMPFYPNDVNRHPINGGDPEILPSGFFGLTYYHGFKGRLAHIFQLKLSNHQIKYWRTTDQTWYYNHEEVTVKADSGDYHIKYQDLAMDYMLGYSLNKKVKWNVYGGLQIFYTVANHSTKTVDRVEYGKLDGFEFIPFSEPHYIYDETSHTFSPSVDFEILFRTDVRFKMGDHWSLRPALEYGLNPGHVQVSVKDRIAFYFELTRRI